MTSRRRAFAGQVLPLEARVMFCADPAHDAFGDDVGTFRAVGLALGDVALPAAGEAVAAAASLELAAAGLPLGSIPALDSRPGAAVKVYLDFDGDVTPTWVSESPGVTPAYDQDGDPLTFSSGELASIRDVWARVSEKYSPFNVDVTTVDPGNLTNRATLKVVIGGDGAWLGDQAGGVAYVGSFSSSLMNTVFVFPDNLSNGNAKYVAECAAHESGHAFGLEHQGLWSGDTLADEYNPGTATAAPVMGGSYDAPRGLWWRGTPSTSASATQDDMAVIAGTSNGFGYAADDAGGTAALAKAAAVTASTFSNAGVIERTSDVDVFSLATGAGTISASATVAAKGATLDLKLELRDVAGTVLASSDTAGLGETLSATVPAGTYYLNVMSHGGYGDVGTYTLSGSMVATAPVAPAAPEGLVATGVSTTEIRLDWADRAAGEAGYRVYRSFDGVTWSNIATLSPDATTYLDRRLHRATLYRYKASAFAAGGLSGVSAVASVRTKTGAAVSSIPQTSTAFSSTLIATAPRALLAAAVKRATTAALFRPA